MTRLPESTQLDPSSPTRLSLYLTFIATFVTGVAFIDAALHPVAGYVISWVGVLRPATWVAISIAIPVFFILLSRKDYGQSAVIGAGVTLLIGLQPILQGYTGFGRDDPSTYVGFAHSMLQAGAPTQSDLYPLIHLLITQISMLSGAPIEASVSLLSPVLYFSWLAAVAIGAHNLTNSSTRTLLAVSLGTIPVFSQYHFVAYPNAYALTLLTLLIACWFRRDVMRERMIFLLTLLLIPFAHPTVALLAVGFTLATQLLSRLRIRRIDTRQLRPPISAWSGVVVLLSWVLSFPQIQLLIQRSFAIDELRRQSQLSAVTVRLLNTSPDSMAIAMAVIVLIGAPLVLTTLAAVAFRPLTAVQRNPFTNLIIAAYVCFAIAGVGLLLSPTLGQAVVFLRAITLPYPMLVIPWAIAAWSNFEIGRRRIAGLASIALLIALFNVYQSPITFQPNDQVTDSDLMAASWLHEYGGDSAPIYHLQTQPYRLLDRVSGVQERENSSFAFSIASRNATVPDGFGMPAALAAEIGRGNLILVTEFDVQTFTTVWAETGRFRQLDFALAPRVPGTSILYDSGGATILST